MEIFGLIPPGSTQVYEELIQVNNRWNSGPDPAQLPADRPWTLSALLISPKAAELIQESEPNYIIDRPNISSPWVWSGVNWKGGQFVPKAFFESGFRLINGALLPLPMRFKS